MKATDFKPGDRVKLIHMKDPYRFDIPYGALGTVLRSCPEPINTVTVDWDCGFSLNPCLDRDIIVKVEVNEEVAR